MSPNTYWNRDQEERISVLAVQGVGVGVGGEVDIDKQVPDTHMQPYSQQSPSSQWQTNTDANTEYRIQMQIQKPTQIRRRGPRWQAALVPAKINWVSRKQPIIHSSRKPLLFYFKLHSSPFSPIPLVSISSCSSSGKQLFLICGVNKWSSPFYHYLYLSI